MGGFKVNNAREVEFEAERILNFLASLPRGITSAERPVVREIMLRTSGEMLAQGKIFDIVAKNLGAGVYQLRLTHTGDRDPDIGAEEDAANARLMAAAPELADALLATVEHVRVPAVQRDREWHVHGEAILQLALAALTKAGRLP